LADFEELPEHQLQLLSDDDLVAYIRTARQAGRHDAMKPAIGVLAFGYWDNLVNRARLKLPEPEVEQVAGEALESAIASAFDGSSVGEFRSWLHTILSRRIADYWQKRERTLPTEKLVSEHQGAEEVWGEEPAVGFEGDALHAHECVTAALLELPEAHRQVVRFYVFGPHSAASVVDLVGDGMTEANVHQISSRYQRRVKELLDEGEFEE
jgi:DNA-directed RNA polymerase specialized sigma24 family protein